MENPAALLEQLRHEVRANHPTPDLAARIRRLEQLVLAIGERVERELVLPAIPPCPLELQPMTYSPHYPAFGSACCTPTGCSPTPRSSCG